MCDFVNDCENKNDEYQCIASCDLEGDDTCGWHNSLENDMDWSVWQGKTPSNGTGPPFDHTRGNKYGMHFSTITEILYINTFLQNYLNVL